MMRDSALSKKFVEFSLLSESYIMYICEINWRVDIYIRDNHFIMVQEYLVIEFTNNYGLLWRLTPLI